LTLSPGTRLGPYEVVAQIGVGGMGEVYRATDTKLKRQVALKILPASLAADPDRLGRFQREAEVLASLNHPNIAAIYGLEDADGVKALVMELVEGPTLADRITQGAIAIDEALPIAKQIAEALEAAHEQGIIHRDLKPANIKVRSDGTVKVLDFGLAKAMEPVGTTAANASMSPTITSPAMMTGVGMILGTAAYMSPEQASGKPVDKRADIWAFGVVLWEMMTGRRLFEGETVSHVLAAVLTKTPDLSVVPARTRELLARCLDKDPRKRLRDVGDAQHLVRPDEPPALAGTGRNGRRAAIAAVVVLSAAFAGGLWYLRQTAAPSTLDAPFRLSVMLGGKAVFSAQSSPSISPDGKRIVFSAAANGVSSLWVRELTASESRPLPGTEGGYFPFWAPDGQQLAFFADGKLKKTSASAGSVQVICDAVNTYVGSWSSTGLIVLGNFTSGLTRVASSGGTPVMATTLNTATGEISHRYPWFLPDGRRLLFLIRKADSSKSVIAIADVDVNGSIGTPRPLTQAESALAYANGYLLFVRGRRLVAQQFALDGERLVGEALPVAEPIDGGGNAGQFLFTASQTGILAFASGIVGGDTQLTWFDRAGHELGLVSTPGDIGEPRVSPDGSTIAFSRRDPVTGLRDIWLHDVQRNATSRLTSNARDNATPIWSRDGNALVFSSLVNGVVTTYRRNLRGSVDEAVAAVAKGMLPADWLDGNLGLITSIQNANTNWDIWSVPLSGGQPRVLANTPGPERRPRVSPNGRWLAYQDNVNLDNEVYVQDIVNSATKVAVSTGGGSFPVWSRDGRSLYYSADDALMAAAVNESAEGFTAGVPRRLFEVHILQGYDVAADGRFIIPREPTRASVPLTIVLNWPQSVGR
jgi:serine/threonine protein kinase